MGEASKSKDEERVRSPTSAKIAMFEKKEEVKPKPNRPTKRMNKKKVGALNSKFANLNINPAALKPNGKAKINKVHRDGGVIDHKPKEEQAIVPKGKRRKRKKPKYEELENEDK